MTYDPAGGGMQDDPTCCGNTTLWQRLKELRNTDLSCAY